MRFRAFSLSNKIALALTVFYTCLTPKIYFRHDDWLMLGNSVLILPKDWNFLWHPSWFISPSLQEVWFFRPGFKLIVWASYQLFAFQSWLWTLTHWSFILGSAFLGGLALRKITSSSRSFDVFLILFLCSISFHFACVVWMGEGMMNGPQLLLLSLSIWGFAQNSIQGNIVSGLGYALALGFKESSAFLPLFFIALSFSQGHFRRRRPFLLGLIALMVLYLVGRLGLLPFNPGYKPHLTFHSFFLPLMSFFVILSLPLIALVLISRSSWGTVTEILRRFMVFLPFIGLLIAPHLGHGFFSPGWFLLPGYLSVWVIVYVLPPMTLNDLKLTPLALLCFFLSLVPILWKASELKWIQWEKSQKQVHQFLRSIPQDTDEVWIETCPPPDNSSILFERVVGSAGNLEFILALHQEKPVPVKLLGCQSTQKENPPFKKIVRGKWQFPDFFTESGLRN